MRFYERASSASLTDSLSEEDSSEALCGGKSHEIKENYQDVDYEDFARRSVTTITNSTPVRSGISKHR